MTPDRRVGSHSFYLLLVGISAACTRSEAQPLPEKPAHGESCLGVPDKGVFGDLDEKVQLSLPAVAPERVTARIDRKRNLLVVSIDDHPRKIYPLTGTATLTVGKHELALRPGDRKELQPLLTESRTTEGEPAGDRDKDGIPDALDILIGAKKTVINADAYTSEAQGYIKLKYPGGDVDRKMGVCTDVVIRSVRNAGLDLQKELHEDIKKRRNAFPMIKKGKGPDANIDQRRVGTLLPYFKKHWESHTAKLDDPKDPLRPGDIILMDTFPSRSGPDHIGIVSDQTGESGLPLIINNWTNGTVTSEMDLLSFVPVLYRFRMRT